MAAQSLNEAFGEAFVRCTGLDAPLAVQLSAFAAEVRALSSTFGDAVDALVARLAAQEVGVSAPGVGEEMPDFLLPDERGQLVSLEQLLAGGPAVLIFHRGHWCPYCGISSIAFAKAEPEISALGGRMAAILPDRPPYSTALKSRAGSRFPFLTDLDNGYAMSLNLVFWVGHEMVGLIAASGIDVPRYQGNASWFLPVPAVFVVGQDGRVRARFVDPDYRRRVAIEDLVAAVQAAAGADRLIAPTG